MSFDLIPSIQVMSTTSYNTMAPSPRNRRRRSSVSPTRSHHAHAHVDSSSSSRRSVSQRPQQSVRSFHRNPGLVTPPTHTRAFRFNPGQNNNNIEPSSHLNSNNIHRPSARNNRNSLAFLAPPVYQENDHQEEITETRTASTSARIASATSASANTSNPSSSSSNWLRGGLRSPTASPTKSPSAHLRKRLSNLRQGSISKVFKNNNNTNNNNIHQNTTNNTNTSDETSSNHDLQLQSAQLTASKIHAHKIRKHHLRQMTARLQHHHRQRYGSAVQQDLLDILEFWRTTCPSEVTLKILAYCGPTLMAHLQQTQRHVHQLLQYDVSWRVLCEELYKYNSTSDNVMAIQTTWKEHYRRNPVVPIDFSTVGQALAMVGAGWTRKEYTKYTAKQQQHPNHHQHAVPEIQHPVTVWVRLDNDNSTTYEEPYSIPIATLRRNTQVTIRTMYTTQEQRQRQKQKQQPKHSSLNSSAVEQQEECHPDHALQHLPTQDNPTEDNHREEDTNHRSKQDTNAPQPLRARLTSRPHTRRRNEPLFRVLRGQLVLKDIELDHATAGVDIWSGNAAVHIQPSSVTSVLWLSSASASIHNSSIRSSTGRGIVAVEGGHVVCHGSYIHHCAATGVYVGGRGSTAILNETDVWYNGVGNVQASGGIARGHSGIYVEQNKSLELNRCSVAYNTACGISLIGSPVQPAVLEQSQQQQQPPHANNHPFIVLGLRQTHVLSNGCSPMDMPQGVLSATNRAVPAPIAHAVAADLESLQQNPYALWLQPEQENRIGAVGVPQAASAPLQEDLERRRRAAMLRQQAAKDEEHRQERELVQRQQQAVLNRALEWNSSPPWNEE